MMVTTFSSHLWLLLSYLFNKLHNLLFRDVTCDKVVNISDNIHTDGAGEVILGSREGAGQQAGEESKDSLHCVERSGGGEWCN